VHTCLPKAKQYIAAVFVAPSQQALMENMEPQKEPAVAYTLLSLNRGPVNASPC
jgi:hypothetical protein